MTDAVKALWRRSAVGRLLRLCSERENRPVAAVLCLCAVFLLWKARYLHYHDLAFEYPFLKYDSFDWIREGLFYRGYDIDPAYRNPGLPLVIAVLGALGIEAWLPLLNVGLLGAFTVYLVLFLRPLCAPVPAALAVLLTFFTFSLQRGFDEILADQWAVTFLLAAMVNLLSATEDPRDLVWFGLFAGGSFLFQYAIAALAPALLFYALRDLRPRVTDRARFDRALIAGLAAAALLVLPLFLFKTIRFGNPFHSRVVQFALFKPHFFGVLYYLFNFCAFFGIVVAAFVVVGCVRGLRLDGADLLANLSVLSYALFWIIGYVWLDPRFLLYFAPFAALYLARALEHVNARRWLSIGAGGTVPQVVVGWSLLLFALLCGLYEKENPYIYNELPLTPQTELVLGVRPVTNWAGNVTISLAGMHLVDTTEDVPALRFLFDHYRRHRNSVDPGLAREESDLAQMRAMLPPRAAIAGCNLPPDHSSRLRREIALQRRVRDCEDAAPLKLLPAGEARNDEVVFSGAIYRLIRLRAQTRPGAENRAQ